MFAPGGDAKNPCRPIGDSLERGITLQFCEALKKEVELLYKNVRVILTRFPGETIHHLQNANFSNRLDVDFYLSVHFFPEIKTKPNMFLFYFSYNDEFVTKIPDLYFCPYDYAHRINGKKTRSYAKKIATMLTSDLYKKLFDFHGPYGFPFRPLIGIKAPSIAIEIGLKEKTDWKKYIEPIAISLQTIVPLHE